MIPASHACRLDGTFTVVHFLRAAEERKQAALPGVVRPLRGRAERRKERPACTKQISKHENPVSERLGYVGSLRRRAGPAVHSVRNTVSSENVGLLVFGVRVYRAGTF